MPGASVSSARVGLAARSRRSEAAMFSRWKRRQHDPPRAAVEVAVDRQQAVAHQPDQVAEVALAPGEVGSVRDEHVVVGLRPEHEHDVRVEQPQREDRAVALVATRAASPAVRRRSGACAAARSCVSPGGNGNAAKRSSRRSSSITENGLLSSIGGGSDERHARSLAQGLAGRPVSGWRTVRRCRGARGRASDAARALAY